MILSYADVSHSETAGFVHEASRRPVLVLTRHHFWRSYHSTLGRVWFCQDAKGSVGFADTVEHAWRNCIKASGAKEQHTYKGPR